MLEKYILEVINTNEVTSQSELLEKLKQAIPEEVDQPTLSRKLKKLGVVKENGIYKQSNKKVLAKQLVKSLVLAEPNMVIIKTLPGAANAIAIIIDNALEEGGGEFSQIAGTVAGDDTIFIAVTSPKYLLEVKEQLNSLLM
jgi:transcriptional regulator of arginine metabolism